MSPALEVRSVRVRMAGGEAGLPQAAASAPALAEAAAPAPEEASQPAALRRRPDQPAPPPVRPPVAQPAARGPAGAAAAFRCPDARTCPRYALVRAWPAADEGRVVIHYWINPAGAPLPSEQVVAAITRAAEVWMAADPKVVLVFEGLTEASPESWENVFGFGPRRGGLAAYTIGPYPGGGPEHRSGFGVVFDATATWTWLPCQPPASPCTPYRSGGVDFGATAVHEWGHVLGLGHVDGPGDEELTMRPGGVGSGPYATRHKFTLGLGDVLGLRALYPTEAPLPVIYRP